MLGAIYIGLSGMEAYSKGLQTISNNVANLNSLGYKETTASFSDSFSSGGAGSSYTDETSGEQSGNGVSFDDSHVDFSQGELQQTNGALDLAIQGSGFLVLKNGNSTQYVRTGQFTVGNDGYIGMSGVEGHLAVLDSLGHATALNIDAKRTSTPTATTTITFSNNISSDATSASVSDIVVRDSNGGEHTWQVALAPTAGTAGEWTATVTDQTGATVGTGTLKFTNGAIDPASSKITIASQPTGADPLSVVLDFSQGVTSYASGTTSTLQASAVDGNAAGDLSTITVDDTGQVVLTYSNGKTQDAGAVALADFRDPEKLQRASNGVFTNQGTEQPRLLASGVDGSGTLESKELEASNVDLSSEFGQLILIQRGFQASSQVVSVSNDMIQQLFGIRGQS